MPLHTPCLSVVRANGKDDDDDDDGDGFVISKMI
jgi:hypothetical protein